MLIAIICIGYFINILLFHELQFLFSFVFFTKSLKLINNISYIISIFPFLSLIVLSLSSVIGLITLLMEKGDERYDKK